MGYYTYCVRCGEGLGRPTLSDLRQGYMECPRCGTSWDDIDRIDSLFELLEDLQEQVNRCEKSILA